MSIGIFDHLDVAVATAQKGERTLRSPFQSPERPAQQTLQLNLGNKSMPAENRPFTHSLRHFGNCSCVTLLPASMQSRSDKLITILNSASIAEKG